MPLLEEARPQQLQQASAESPSKVVQLVANDGTTFTVPAEIASESSILREMLLFHADPFRTDAQS